MDQPRPDLGFLIMIDTLRGEDDEACRYASHLLSNIAASMELGDLPKVPTFTARVGGMFVPYGESALGNPEAAGDFVMDHYDPQVHEQALHRLYGALEVGSVAIMDEVLVHADRYLHEHGRALDLEQLLTRMVRKPDLVLYVEGPPDAVQEADQDLHRQFYRLPEVFPDYAVVIPYASTHAEMCDQVWQEASRRMLGWAARRRAVLAD